MSVYLAYYYSVCLTEKKKNEIDKKVKKSREEFYRGFRKGTQVSLSIYFVYLLTAATAYADNTCPDSDQVAPAPGNNGVAKSAPNNKPGFKPLTEGPKGAFVGGASAICGAALQNGEFLLGVACATLLVIGGIIVNRDPKPPS